MSSLLTKRLARSLLKRKLMLFAVVGMIAVGLFAGISFGTYANSVHNLYDDIYFHQIGRESSSLMTRGKRARHQSR